MDMDRIKDFLIKECGYKSIEDAIKNTPKVNLYPIYGELPQIKEDRLYERIKNF